MATTQSPEQDAPTQSPVPRTPRTRVLTPALGIRIALGWGAVVVLALAAPALTQPLSGPALTLILATLIGVIIACATGVVTQAEHLAHRLGDPYGSLVLTLSIVLIEVILISAVMLGPSEYTTIARDSVMAVAMIILTLVLGLCLLVRRTKSEHARALPNVNPAGTSTYLSVLVVLILIALALPGLIGSDGAYSPAQAWIVVVLTVALYGYFLKRQIGGDAGAYRVENIEARKETQPDASRREPVLRVVALVVLVLPIVLLSHDMAALLDDGLGRVGAPAALVGILIALIVFLPESLTAVRAARAGDMQRASNLCHGALVSTVGLTVPAVLVIGALTGQTVILAESATNLILLATALALSAISFLSPRTTTTHGAAHLVVFALWLLAVFT